MIEQNELRARQDAFRREYNELRAREFANVGDELQALIDRLAKTPRTTEPMDAVRRNRVAERRERLLQSGAPRPRQGTPAHSAWERVLRATDAQEACVLHHPGSKLLMRAVDWWLVGGRKFPTVIFQGKSGTGKTVASWYALASKSGLFLAVSEIAPIPSWDTTRRAALRTGLLVVNDVHERLSPWAWGALAGVIEERHDAGELTLITTNVSQNVIFADDKLGHRVASRFGQGKFILATGDDLRGTR